MEVSCQRCQTEYDFDDALIAERGTSVRCTTCGFEFKVLPDPGSSRQSFVVLGEDGEERLFASLGELQRAIARGVVRENDLLRRGNGEPRRLGSIAELVPLLRQSRSVPPPSSEPARLESLGGARHGSRTRIGLPSIADLERMRGAESEPVSAREPDSRPRIQSPLSQRSIPEAEALSNPPASPRGKLPSLSDTLLGRTSKAPLSRDSLDASPREAPDLEVKRSSSIPPPLPAFSNPREAAPTSASSPQRAPSLPPEVVSELPRSSGRPSVHSVSDLGDARASSEPDLRGRPTGSLPGKPRARLAPVVLAAVVGFGGYYLYGRVAPRSVPQESNASRPGGEGVTSTSVRELDVEGLRLRLLGKSESDVRARAQTTLDGVRDVDWLLKVDLLRLAGKVDDARRLFAERSGSAPGTSAGREHALAIALLDVADASAEPPWAVVAERLEEAARGELPPYFAAAARIWALVEGDRIAEAKAALHDFERFPDVAASPLLAPLVVFVRQAEETAAAAASTEHTVELAPIGISTEEAERRTKSVVGPEVKKLVAEADAHWGAGEREPAVELYRKVFRKVGPEHFLGQKAMARIKQAERELSTSGSPP